MTVDKKGWRDVLKIHPAADLFPSLSEPELRELAENIKKRGLLEQPTLYRDPELGICVLDGRNRLDACELYGRETVDVNGNPKVGTIKEYSRSFDPVGFVLSKNLYRRHLTTEQKRELIEKVLKAKPETSNATVAKQVKADDKTVAKVRRKLESTSEIPKLNKTVGADGKSRPKIKKSAKPTSSSKMDSGKAVAPPDNALSDFNARLMELLRLIGRHQPTRFTKTAVKADDLARVGKFLSDLAQIKTTTRAKAECAS